MPKLVKIKKHRASLADITNNECFSSNSNSNYNYGSSASFLDESSIKTSSSRSSLSGRQEKKWEEHYDELVKFKVLFGSCRVPHRYPENPGLSRWVVYMRSAYQTGSLTQERIDKLNQIEFVWSDRGHTTWDKRFEQLEAYKASHGTTRVSCDSPASQQLWRWCSVQRANYRLGKLAQPRIQALNGIGFIWDVDQYDWDSKYSEMRVFHASQGHCRLPNKEPYKKLFLWARVQRTKYHYKSLSQGRIEKLELVGFGWEKNSMYTNSTGHVTMDVCGKTDQALDVLNDPQQSTFCVTALPQVTITKSIPPKMYLGGFDRLLQLAELAKQFSPVPTGA